jgi:2-amino-4-hydroxy-6-hydroxymethyldihydropteridine diphosphokinase
MPHCLISFGSNLGDRFQRIAMAGKAIAESPLVNSFRASRLYENPAIGGPIGQQPFLNGVALLETESSAREILGLLQAVELRLGRQRAVRWDARSIDLDVVLYGDLQGNSPDLSVPHPRYTARRFVIVPADEVAGQWRDPRFLWSIHELNAHISATVPSIALVGGEKLLREQLCQLLTERYGIATFCDPRQPIELSTAAPWVSSFLPPLPPVGSVDALNPWTPRLVAQLQWTTPASRWPATHQIGKALHDWPEYRLEVDSPEWAASELAAAIESLGCPLVPTTVDGLWYLNADQ